MLSKKLERRHAAQLHIKACACQQERVCRAKPHHHLKPADPPHTHQGHPVALANARELSHGTPAPLLHSALRQFLGAATPADDVAALVAWWGDEVRERGAAGVAGERPLLL